MSRLQPPGQPGRFSLWTATMTKTSHVSLVLICFCRSPSVRLISSDRTTVHGSSTLRWAVFFCIPRLAFAGRLGPANTPYLPRIKTRRHSPFAGHASLPHLLTQVPLRRSIPSRTLRVLLHSKICCAYFAGRLGRCWNFFCPMLRSSTERNVSLFDRPVRGESTCSSRVQNTRTSFVPESLRRPVHDSPNLRDTGRGKYWTCPLMGKG